MRTLRLRVVVAFTSGLCLGLALAAASVAAAKPAADEQHRRLALFVTSGLSGHYSDGDQTIAELVATLRADAEAARAEGRDVVVLDAGRTLVPYAESRADRGAAMARVLNALGCDAFVPAPMDLNLHLEHVAALAPRFGCPIVSAFDIEAPEAGKLLPKAVLELGGERPLELEIRSLFDPVFFGDLQALGIDAHRVSLDRLGQEHLPGSLRILVVHSRGFGDALVDRDLTWDVVREPHGFDLVIDPDLGHDLDLERRTDDGSVFLIGRALDTADPWTYARLDLDLRWQDGQDDGGSVGRWRPVAMDWSVRRPDPAVSADPVLRAELERAFDDFRAIWSEPLPDGAPTDRAGLVDFALAAMRERARAEIAVVNRGVLRPVAEHHWTQPLRRETVLRLLTLDQQLDVGTLSGTRLRELVAESARRRGPHGLPTGAALRFLGLAWQVDAEGMPVAKTLQVNGRPLLDDDLYRVVTNTFLTSGGDDYPILAGMDGTRLEIEGQPLEARDDIVLPRLREPRRPLYDPTTKPLWRMGIEQLTLDINDVSIRAASDYAEVSDSRASASDTTQARIDLGLFADQDWPLLRWENRLRVRFGVIETDTVEELTDDLRLEVAAVFHRTAWRGSEPYLAYVFDSELRRNEDGGRRLPRQHEQSLATGFAWKTSLWPRLRLGLMARHQDDVEQADRLGVVAEVGFRKPARGRRPGIAFDGLLERVSDTEATISRVDLDLRLVFELSRGLALTPGVEFYLYDDSRLDGAAVYRGLSVGLRWAWVHKVQR